MSTENLQAQIAKDQQQIADAGYAVYEKNKPIPYTQLRRIEVETGDYKLELTRGLADDFCLEYDAVELVSFTRDQLRQLGEELIAIAEDPTPELYPSDNLCTPFYPHLQKGFALPNEPGAVDNPKYAAIKQNILKKQK